MTATWVHGASASRTALCDAVASGLCDLGYDAVTAYGGEVEVVRAATAVRVQVTSGAILPRWGAGQEEPNRVQRELARDLAGDLGVTCPAWAKSDGAP